MKTMRLSILGIIACSVQAVRACELCTKEQPAVLQGISHGTGPEGYLDYFIIWTAALVVGITLVLSIKHLIKPERNSPDHIKNLILEKEDYTHGY